MNERAPRYGAAGLRRFRVGMCRHAFPFSRSGFGSPGTRYACEPPPQAWNETWQGCNAPP